MHILEKCIYAYKYKISTIIGNNYQKMKFWPICERKKKKKEKTVRRN